MEEDSFMPLRDKDRDQDKPAADLLRRSLASPAGSPGSDIGACPDPEILAAYSERSLDADETTRYELHFSQCTRCREQLAALVRAGEPMDATEEQRPSTAWIWDWRWLALPVTAALVLAAAFVARRPAQHPVERLEPPLVAINQPAAPPAASATTPLARESALAPPAPASDSSPAASSPARISPNLNSAKSEIVPLAPPHVLDEKQRTRDARSAPFSGRDGSALYKVAKPAEAKKADASPQAENAPFTDTLDGGATVETAGPEVSRAGAVLPAPAAAPKSARSEPMSTALLRGRSLAQSESVMVEAGDTTSARTLVRTPDPQVLWRLSSGRFVERSSNAGSTWQVQWTSPNAHLVAGTAPTADTCWLVGRGGMILLTTDGRNWKTVTPPADADFVSVVATDASSATVTAVDDRKFTTNDSGKHWTPAP
jgi:hypothetical protein